MGMRMKILNLTLVGHRKNYSIDFHDGLNFISGHTSTGKTSILEMIDYALGSKSHKSYIEIGNTCTDVQLELLLGAEKYIIRRRLFDFNAPVIVEDWNEDKGKYLFYNRLDVDNPSNAKSLSAFLIEKIGLPDIKISNQVFSFRDLFKYSYLKQTDIDNENILGEKDWPKNLKRKGTFEIIFNLFDEMMESLKSSLEEKKNEASELKIKLEGINEFISSTDFSSVQKYNEVYKQLTSEITEKQKELSVIKNDKGINTKHSNDLRNRILQNKHQLEILLECKNDQNQYIVKLRLLLNQYNSEIDKKGMAFEGYIAFNKYEYVFCPNCLKPISQTASVETCCLCGNEMSEDKSELLQMKKEIATLKRKSNELVKFIEEEDKKYNRILSEYNYNINKLKEAEAELQHLYKDYVNPHMEQIELLSYEIGQRNRLLLELQQNLNMLEEVERYEQIIKTKEDSIKNIKENIKTIKENAIDKQDLIKRLTQEFTSILTDFEYPKLSTAYIDENTYLPFVRGRKYNDIGSLAGVSLITMAYYLAVLIEGADSQYSHLNILMIDSPRKNLGAQAPQGEEDEFKDEKIFNCIIKYLIRLDKDYKDKIQLIIVNNGYPEFLQKETIIAEFDAESHGGLPRGLIDDAN